jgi:hypothetical protein
MWTECSVVVDEKMLSSLSIAGTGAWMERSRTKRTIDVGVSSLCFKIF